MELKLLFVLYPIYPFLLLIVPYGIETEVVSYSATNEQPLLIVPYGIETFHLNVNRHRLMFF